MVNLTINDQKISVNEGTTILDAALKVGIDIPHLCFLKEINEIGACRACVVENAGMDTLIPACNTPVEEGMQIYTNSPKAREARRINVGLILSDHDCKCATCVRSGNCNLQKISNDLGMLDVPYENTAEKSVWKSKGPLIRDASKCIKCMRCIQVCDKVQGMKVWNLSGSGYRTTVGITQNVVIDDTNCTFCGQCVTHCPVGALRERDDTGKMLNALADPDKITMVQIAPAVRTAWGESLGLYREESTMGKFVAALKQIGFDYVFDTVYSADLTIMEEGSEFVSRFREKDKHKWPLFTSCCPGWIRFVKNEFPEFAGNLSSAKSPQQMFGAMSKTYIAEKLGIAPEKIYSVSIMPCMAKKYECDVEEVNDAGVGQDVDLVLTTREISRLINADRIKVGELEEAEFDDMFGESTGAGIIFGATGGVMEAALRSAHFLLTGKNPKTDAFKKVRGIKGWKEAIFEIEGIAIKVAVANGLGNTRQLLTALKNGEVEYDFVEIMACPGGCAGGGGQPIHDGVEMAEERGRTLYGMDSTAPLRFSHENPAVLMSYDEFLGSPLSEKAHKLLHTHIEDWKL